MPVKSNFQESVHPCLIIHKASGQNKIYGETPGTCRITGVEGTGLPFDKWVKDTFTDHAYLRPGEIICNEALFCFDEQSEFLREKTGREKPQRFRTYTHIVAGGVWYLLTKADKKRIFELITTQDPEIVCLSESGQKHLLFKNRHRFWQLEETVDISPDVETMKLIHSTAQKLMELGFSQTEIITGNYPGYKFMKIALADWQDLENIIKPYRFTKIFDITTWMLFQ